MERRRPTRSRSGPRLLPCSVTPACLSRDVRKLDETLGGRFVIAQCLLIGPCTHPLVTSIFWCSLLKSQGRFFLLHCPHGAVPEHFIFCWRQRLQAFGARFLIRCCCCCRVGLSMPRLIKLASSLIFYEDIAEPISMVMLFIYVYIRLALL